MPILGIWASANQRQFISTTAYESIATATPSGTGTVNFTSIPQTYTHLQLRVFNQYAANDRAMGLRLNSDSGSNYSVHGLYGQGSSAGAFGAANYGITEWLYNYDYGSGYASTSFVGGIIDILDYTNTNKYKTLRSLEGVDYNGAGNIFMRSASWRSTSAVTSINLTIQGGGNFATGTSIALYGIKGA